MRHTAHGWWIEQAGAPERRAPLRGRRRADVVVVGGGYTGMWAAWHVKAAEPQADVALLEADGCGLGPSGRNGGFANSMWFSAGALRRHFGDGGALAICRAAEESVAEIGRFCRDNDVDAEWTPGGYLQASAAPAQDPEPARVIDDCRALGAPEAAEPLDADEVAARCDSPRLRGGALFPGSATVQPAALAFGLRERLIEAGVAVFEGSPMRALRALPGGVVVETPGGSVRAPRCLLAVGPASGARGSPFRGRLTVSSSHLAITEPVGELLERIGWTGGECITDARATIHYFRTTRDGRIAFGWGGGSIAWGARLHGRSEVDRTIARRVIADLRSFFPGLAGRRIEQTWGGPIDVSPSHLPVVLTRESGRVAAAFGYTGNGVGPSQMIGRTLASLALDRRDAHSRLAFVDAPLRRVPTGLPGWLGGNLVRAALLRVEDTAEAGHRADPASRAVATLPERIGFHIGR